MTPQAETVNIYTGADHLLGLVNDQVEISVSRAADRLNVDRVVVEGWSRILEEAGLVLTRHTFTDMHLVSKEAHSKMPTEAMVNQASVLAMTKSLWNGNGNGKVLSVSEREDKLKGKEEQVKESLKLLQAKLAELKKYQAIQNEVLLAQKKMVEERRELEPFRKQNESERKEIVQAEKRLLTFQAGVEKRLADVTKRENELKLLSKVLGQKEKTIAAAEKDLSRRKESFNATLSRIAKIAQ